MVSRNVFLIIRDRLNVIKLWNVILDVYQRRDKGFIIGIIPVNRPAQLHMNSPYI
jgi:hypothetical protein